MADETTDLIRKILAHDEEAPVTAYKVLPKARPEEHTIGADSGPSIWNRAGQTIGDFGTSVKEGLFGKTEVVPGSRIEAPQPTPATLPPAAPSQPGPWSGPVDQYGQPAVARAPRVPANTGAIPPPAPVQPNAVADPTVGIGDTSALPAALPAAATPDVTTKPLFKAPTLVEEYSKALKELKTTDTSGKLTAEQRNRAELSFWMNMLAAASEPGARAGGAIGKAGVAALAGMTEQEKENRRAAMDMLKSNKEDVYRMAMLGDKQTDNEREYEKIGITRDHYKAMAEYERLKIGLQIKQIEMGGKEVKSTIQKPDGSMVLVMNDGTTSETGIKSRLPHEPDTRGELAKTIETLKKNFPSSTGTEAGLMETLGGVKSAGKEERDREEEAIGKGAIEILTKDMGGKITMAQAREMAKAAYGKGGALPGAQTGTVISRKSPAYQAALKERGGDAKKWDAEILAKGGRIVD